MLNMSLLVCAQELAFVSCLPWLNNSRRTQRLTSSDAASVSSTLRSSGLRVQATEGTARPTSIPLRLRVRSKPNENSLKGSPRRPLRLQAGGDPHTHTNTHT